MKKLIICISFGAIIYAKAQNFGFLEGHAGIGTFEDKNALVYGVGYHYMNSKNIFSLKYTHLYHITYGFLLSKETRITIDDIAAMYGRIWMLNERTMFTGSGGISYNSYRFTDYTPAEYELHTKEKTIGFPLDLSVRFFSKNISSPILLELKPQALFPSTVLHPLAFHTVSVQSGIPALINGGF